MVEKANLNYTIFVDAFNKSGIIGIGISYLSQARGLTILKAVGSAALLSVYRGELLAIREAYQMVDNL